MKKRSYKQNTVFNFVALVIILYFLVVPFVITIAVGYFGSVEGVITGIVGIIPFGDGVMKIAVQILNAVAGQIISYNEIEGQLTVLYVLQETMKEILTVIVFEILNTILCEIMELNKKGRWIKLRKICVTCFDALLAACMVPLLLNFLFGQISILNNSGQSGAGIVSGIIAALVSLIVTGGGIMFFILLNGFSLLKSLVFVLGKVVFLNAWKLLMSYLCILIVLLAYQQGIYWLAIAGCSGLLGVLIMLAGIDLMLEPLF